MEAEDGEQGRREAEKRKLNEEDDCDEALASEMKKQRKAQKKDAEDAMSHTIRTIPKNSAIIRTSANTPRLRWKNTWHFWAARKALWKRREEKKGLARQHGLIYCLHTTECGASSWMDNADITRLMIESKGGRVAPSMTRQEWMRSMKLM